MNDRAEGTVEDAAHAARDAAGSTANRADELSRQPDPREHRAHGSPTDGHSRHSSRRHSRHHSSTDAPARMDHARLFFVLGIVLILLISAFGWIAGAERIRTLRTRSDELQADLQRRTEQVERLRGQLEQREKEVAELVLGRLPTLHPQEFDKVIELDQKSVRNIVFTLAGKGEARTYEFKVVLENTGEKRINADVSILVFDELGIQIGTAHITTGQDGLRHGHRGLEPGEVKSYSGAIALTADKAPRYFMVTVDDEEMRTNAGLSGVLE